MRLTIRLRTNFWTICPEVFGRGNVMSLIIKMDNIKEEEHLQKAVPYILNEEKTKGLFYSNSGINADRILDTFKFTRDNVKTHGNRVAYHYKFSFSKDEKINANDALAFIRDWVEQYLGDDYDFVCAVHDDRDHLHMHLIFNAVCRTGGKYKYQKGDWERVIKPLTNSLAKKYHTGPIREKDEKLDYYNSKEKRMAWQEIIKRDIDKCISESKSYEDFKYRLINEYDYQLREGVSREHGVYLALTPPGKAKAVRTYQLGDDYMPSGIDLRIKGIDKTEYKNIINPDKDEDYKAIYKYEIWYISRPTSFIPYNHLSKYQQYYVRKMLDAQRLYKGTGSSMKMKERASRAIKGMSEDASFICRMNIRSEKELHKIMEDLSEDYNRTRNETSGQIVQKLENKQQIIKRLRELDNPLYRRKDVKHK